MTTPDDSRAMAATRPYHVRLYRTDADGGA